MVRLVRKAFVPGCWALMFLFCGGIALVCRFFGSHFLIWSVYSGVLRLDDVVCLLGDLDILVILREEVEWPILFVF